MGFISATRSSYKGVLTPLSLLPRSLAFHSMSITRYPPHFANTDHRERCLAQLRSKPQALEKYIYLNGLKGRDSNLFYKILLDNMPVRVADAAKGIEIDWRTLGNDTHLVYTNSKPVLGGRVTSLKRAHARLVRLV